MAAAMKMLTAQNIIDAVINQSIQGGLGADNIKIPETKEELELVQASLVAEAQLLSSIQNRQEDIIFEENGLIVLDSERKEIILEIGSHMVDHEAPKTLETDGEVRNKPASVGIKSETKNELKKEIDQAQLNQISDAPFDFTQKRPVSPAYSDISYEEPQPHSMFLTPKKNSLVPPVSSSLASLNSLVQMVGGTPLVYNGHQNPEVSRSQPNNIAGSNQALDNSQLNNSANDVGLNDSEIVPESANFQCLIMDISDQHSDISDFNDIGFNDKSGFDDLGAPHNDSLGQFQQTDNKVQYPKEMITMGSFKHFAQVNPAKAEELIGKLTEVTGLTECETLYKALDQSRKSDLNQTFNVTIAIVTLLQLQLSEWEQTSASTSHVQKCDRTHKWIATQPLKQSAANDNILPCGPVNENQPDCVKEKTEEFIPLEFMIRSQNSSGFPTIVGQILGHLDFDTLVSCRLVSKDFNNFLDDKTFWIACLDQVRKEYLDKLLVEGNLPKPKCPLVNIMSPKDIKKDYDSWITLIEIIKAKESIEDLINFTKLIKQSEELIDSFASFCPFKFMFAFWATGHPRWVPGFKNLPFNRIKLFKKFVNLEMFEEDDLIEMQWDILIEMVCRSPNPEVVNFFTTKLMNVDSIKTRDDMKNFEEQMERWREENRRLFEARQRRENNFISHFTLLLIVPIVVFTSYHIRGMITRFF